MKYSIRNSWCRGYRCSPEGIITVIDLCAIKGIPVDSCGEPYVQEGMSVVDLVGWPDAQAVQVSDTLLIGISGK